MVRRWGRGASLCVYIIFSGTLGYTTRGDTAMNLTEGQRSLSSTLGSQPGIALFNTRGTHTEDWFGTASACGFTPLSII